MGFSLLSGFMYLMKIESDTKIPDVLLRIYSHLIIQQTQNFKVGRNPVTAQSLDTQLPATSTPQCEPLLMMHNEEFLLVRPL